MQKLYTNCGIDIACIFDLKGDIFSQTHVASNFSETLHILTI